MVDALCRRIDPTRGGVPVFSERHVLIRFRKKKHEQENVWHKLCHSALVTHRHKIIFGVPFCTKPTFKTYQGNPQINPTFAICWRVGGQGEASKII